MITLVAHFDTGNSSELVDKILVTSGSPQPAKKYCIYSVKLEDIRAGDIICFLAQGQVTNDLGKKYDTENFPVQAPHYSILSMEHKGLVGQELTEARGSNVTPMIHHKEWMHGGHYLVTKDYGLCYLNTIIYAHARKSNGKTDYIIIDNDYGRLSGIVLRP